MRNIKLYTPIFYVKDQESDEWIKSNIRVARYFFTLDEAIEYVNDSTYSAIRELRSYGYSTIFLIIPPNKLINSEYSLVMYAYKEGCVPNKHVMFKYEIVIN